MTSRFATNYKFSPQSQVRYLEVNQDGQPTQGQVPLTYQYYSGTGNQTIVYDGSDVIAITSTLSAGPLTIDFSAMNNYLGRHTLFLCEKQILNNVEFDFGSGELYVPPLTTPASSTTLTPDRSPTATCLAFYAINKAMIVGNPTVFPQNIIPGGPGQVLTTNAGTGIVDWEDPQSVQPKSLFFQWSTDVANNLNDSTARQISWVEDSGNNDTTLILAGGTAPGTIQTFQVVDPGKYSISHQEFIVGDPSIVYRSFISIVNNSSVLAYNEASTGLTGSRTSGSITLDLLEDDIIAIYTGNAAGPSTSVVPLDSSYGCLSIVQH